jgi:hypothetical protein
MKGKQTMSVAPLQTCTSGTTLTEGSEECIRAVSGTPHCGELAPSRSAVDLLACSRDSSPQPPARGALGMALPRPQSMVSMASQHGPASGEREVPPEVLDACAATGFLSASRMCCACVCRTRLACGGEPCFG